MYPFHITNKNIVTLPMMSSASKEEEEDGENEEEKEEIEKNLCRMASGPLLGYAANGMAVQLSSQTIPPPMVSHIGRQVSFSVRLLCFACLLARLGQRHKSSLILLFLGIENVPNPQ